MCPRALIILGHMHILFNALEEAGKFLPSSSGFFDNLNDACSFICDPELRRKFMFDCLPPPDRKQYSTCPKQNTAWRWEFLCAALSAVMDRWHLVTQHFDLAKMVRSDAGKLDKKLFSRIATLVKDKMFIVHCAIFFTIGTVVELGASRLEGCECHGDIWKKTTNANGKRYCQIAESTGHRHCVWKGRQAAWWVAVGLSWLLDEITHASSQRLTLLLQGLDPIVTEQALQLFEQLRTKLVEITNDKMSFLNTINFYVWSFFFKFLVDEEDIEVDDLPGILTPPSFF